MLVLTEPRAQKRGENVRQGKGLTESLDLQGIADGGAGGVALDIPDRLGGNAGHAEGLHHRPNLSRHRGGAVAGLHSPVVVDGRSPDDRVHVIAIGKGARQVLEEHGRHPATEDGALSGGIEGAAVAVRRVDVPFFGQVATHLRNADGHPAREHHVALAREQTLTREVHRHQRRRARRLHRDAGAREVQLVRDACTQEVLVVSEVREPRRLTGKPRRGLLGHQVAGHHAAATREHADGAVVCVRIVAGVLEGLPRDLEEQAMLRIHDRRFPRGVAEEERVECFHVAQNGSGLDVVRIQERRRLHTRRQQFRVREEGDRFDAAAEIAPEGGHGVGAGEPARHADDGNPAISRRSRHRLSSPWGLPRSLGVHRPEHAVESLEAAANEIRLPLDPLLAKLFLRLAEIEVRLQENLPAALGPLRPTARATAGPCRAS